MDVMLQRHCAKYIYVVPDGLRELMSDISREVLRSQPQNTYTFIADYLDALMITRENARVAARLVESLTEIGVTIADLLRRTGMTREEADRVATIIQIAFRKHIAAKAVAQAYQQPSEILDEINIISHIIDEAEITPEQAEQAAVIIQNAYRQFKHRQEREKDLLRGMVDWRVAARSTMRLYRKTGVTYEEANRAATLIKAAYKGYYTRRLMKRLLEDSERVSEESMSIMGEDQSQYTTYWERFGRDTDVDFYKDLEEAEHHGGVVKGKAVEDSQAIAVSIVESLMKHIVPSSTSVQSGFTTESPGPFPSEVEPTTKAADGEKEAHEETAPHAEGEPDAVPPSEPDIPTEVIKPPDSGAPSDVSGTETETEYADTTTSEAAATTETAPTE